MNGNLTGTYRVRVLRPALTEARKLFPRARDRAELRRHALKLRFWPKQIAEHQGQLMDLDWSFIRALPGSKVGELRVHDKIGGHGNIRIIFLACPQKEAEPMPSIWVLAVMQKKRADFSQANIETFDARRAMVQGWFYSR